MLEIVNFNKRLYRYREEDEETLLLYNLRNGNMYFLTGTSKELLQKFENVLKMEVDGDNKIIQFFRLIHVLV